MSRERYVCIAANKLLYRRLGGTIKSKSVTMNFAERMAVDIVKRFGKTPIQWQQKHIIWFIDMKVMPLAAGTRRNYKTEVRKILLALEKREWLCCLYRL